MVIKKDPQKQSSNGEETPQERKKREMLASGNWREGDQGELIRVKKEEVPVGLPSKERLSYLEGLDRPLTESEAREYASASFDPSSNMNILFSLVAGAGFDPVGDAAMKVLKGGYNALKGGAGTAKKAIGKGVNILKEVGGSSTSTSTKVANKPENIQESISEGVDFVKGFYRDPIIDKHFTGLYGGQSPITLENAAGKTIDPARMSFRRGATPVSPEPLPRFKYPESQYARGLFDPVDDKTFLSRKFYLPWKQRDPKLITQAGQTATHETAHFASKPMFYTETGAKMEELMSPSLVAEMSDDFFFGPGKDGARALGFRNLDKGAEEYWKYLSDPEEITARTMEMRKLMKEAIMNGRASSKQFPAFDRIKSDEDLSRLMIGDFSKLSDGELEVLAGEIFINSDTNSLKHFMEHLMKGGKDFGSKEFREGLSNLFKHALMVPVAGVAATQVEMIDGGKLKLLKKK